MGSTIKKPQKIFFEDLTLLDANNSNSSLLKHDSFSKYALSKGFKHKGPALHFELKLLRQGSTQDRSPLVNTSDIENLNLVQSNKRGYVIVLASKNCNVKVDDVEKQIENFIKSFSNYDLIKNDLVRLYAFDTKKIKCFKIVSSIQTDNKKNLFNVGIKKLKGKS